MTDLIVHDFAGHPFQAELSRQLAADGLAVVHAYCGGVTTGQGNLVRQAGDPPRLAFVDVSRGRRFERYSPVGRVRSEVTYGRRLAELVSFHRPAAVLSANNPILSELQLELACRRVGSRRVTWVQDFLGRGVRAQLTERLGRAGAVVGGGFETIETALLRRAAALVLISPDFEGEIDRRGVRTARVVVPNWAPLDEIDRCPPDNDWSRSEGIVGRPTVVYAGTLGLKHDPEHLAAAAGAVADIGGVVVVVTEGLGREALEQAKQERQLDALELRDFVPYDQLPLVLGAATVATVLLEADAGQYSVPSKVLSYLAAGRPIVAAMPRENLGARTIEEAGAGIVVRPGDYDGFASAIRSLLLDPADAEARGLLARAYAETHFDVARIAATIRSVL